MGWTKNDDSNNTGSDTSLDFDMDEVKPEEAREFTLLPKGMVPGIVTGFKKLSNEKGWRGVNLEGTVIVGPHKGRKVWGNFTTHNPGSEKAVQIGRGQLKAAFVAAGVGGSDLADLVAAQAPVMLSIKHAKDNRSGDLKAEIGGFRELTSAESASLSSDGEPAPSSTKAPASKPSTKPTFMKK